MKEFHIYVAVKHHKLFCQMSKRMNINPKTIDSFLKIVLGHKKIFEDQIIKKNKLKKFHTILIIKFYSEIGSRFEN